MSIKNVFEQIVSFQNLLTAEKEVGRGAKGRRIQALYFRYDLENNLFRLQECMRNFNLPESKYSTFFVHEPKLRKIVDIDYENKVIQRAIYDVVNPLICRTMISDTFSCIKERGQIHAMQRLYEWERHLARKNEEYYYLKLDISKFFYRINQEKLSQIVEKKIGDRRATALIKHYICNAPVPFGLPIGADPGTIAEEDMLWDIGIAIGGGLSHMLGNMYLDPLDQYCKRELQARYYVRYMDDIIILSNCKKQLHIWKDTIEWFLDHELELQLNNKTAIRPMRQGVEFVGFRIWPTHVTIRKSTSLRMKRWLARLQEMYKNYEISFERVTETVSSYKALLKQCNCYRLDQRIFRDFVLTHEKEPANEG